MSNFFKKFFFRKDEPTQLADSGKPLSVTATPEAEHKVTIPPPENIIMPEERIEAADPESKIPTGEPYDLTRDLPDYNYPNPELFSSHANVIQALNETEAALPVIWSAMGEKIEVKDLAELNNILITGSQMTGKTTFIHQLVLSLLYKKHPCQLKLIFADEKGIEFSLYKKLDKHFNAKLPAENCSIIESVNQLSYTLNAVCIEMDNRYDLLKDASERNIRDYNLKFEQRALSPQKGHQYLPFIVVIIDDLGGFLALDPSIETPLLRIVNQGHRVGVYTIISTSQYGGRLFPGNLISQIGQRVVFNLNSRDDYRKFFDTVRLKSHLTQGEFLYNEAGKIKTGYTILIELEELENVVEYIQAQKGYPIAFMLPEYVDDRESGMGGFNASGIDSLFEDAARLIVQNQIGSTSLLQRRMKLGYNRAGRLMDQLEAAGIVGPDQGSKARDVLIKTELDLRRHLNALF